jgi:acyl-CoA thioesterase FadM
MYRANDTSGALVDAELIYVCVDLASGAATGWPAAARRRMRGYEKMAPLETAGRG